MPVPVIVGLLGRAGIAAGAKHLSKKAARRSIKKTAQEKTTDGVGEIAAMGLGGGAAAASVSRLQLEQIAEKRALAERERAERERAEKAKTKEEKEVDGMRSGGRVSGSSMGGSVRGGGCEIRGKTKGRII